MKLRYFDVERFGVWNNARLDGLENGLTVIYGPNGSGKTTLMQFVRAVFYGRPIEGSRRYLPSVHTGSQGGRVGVTQQDREYVVNRFWESNIGSDDATITRPDGTIHDSVAFRQLLGEVGEDVFNQLFTVGYREAEDFDLIVREALADDGSTFLASDELARVQRAIANIDATVDRLPELEAERNRLREEISRLSAERATPPAELIRVRERIAELEARIRELQELIAQLEAEIARCESMPAPAMAINSAGERVKRLEKQIANWRNWQREIEEQLIAVRNQLHYATLQDCDPVEFTPQAQIFRARSSMTVVENQLSDLQDRMAGLRISETIEGRESLQSELASLKDRVFQLCDQLGHHEVLDEIASLEAESIQLSRCQAEIDRQLSLMLQRRRILMQQYADGAPESYRRHNYVTQAKCHSPHHDEWLVEPPVVPQPVVNHDLDALIAERERLLAELQAAREELSALAQRRVELESVLRDTEIAKRLEELRFDLNMVEEEIRREQEERDVRTTTRALLEDLRVEYESRRRPLVLAEASEYLSRLTSESRELVENADGRAISVRFANGVTKSLDALSRGERDQVALTLRLALTRAYARRGTRLPLILDDVFITSDSGTAEATATLLRDFAADNQQILFFTCHEHIARMFRNLGVTVRDLPALRRPEVIVQPQPLVQKVVVEPPKPVPVVTAPWVAPTPPAESLVVKAYDSDEEGLKEVRNTVGFEPSENWIFYTELTTPVDELTGITDEQAAELESSGVHTVEDLLAMIPDNAAMQLSQLGLTPAQIREWQSQALLSCRVPMLHRRDAELLVLCGITTPEQLSDSHPDDVYDRVSVYLKTDAGSRFIRKTSPFDRQTAINWVRWAAHARTLWHSRERSPRPPRQYGAASALMSGNGNGNGSSNGNGSRLGSSLSSRSSSGSSGDGNGSSSSSSTRSRRSSSGTRSSSRSRRSTSSRSSSSRSTSSRRSGERTTRTRESRSEVQTETTRQLRFYLERDAEVEDAPSIGPKTAEHLAKVNIITVRDLLEADADTAAAELGHKRIKGDTIREWQQQAALVCCVPELRGHDSQILVACEVTTAEELASFRPADLFAKVAPFVDTSEGERIVRNGKKPDLEEITFWIDCAQKARTLQAA